MAVHSLEHLAARLQVEGISPGQLLEMPRLELLHATRLFPEELEFAAQEAAERIMPRICTARALRLATAHLRTRLPRLDAALAGGLSVGTITEIAGTAGSGKTQVCMHMVACALLDDDAAHAIYIDTERSFSPRRLAEIWSALARGEPDADGAGDDAAGGDGATHAADVAAPAVRSALGRVHVVRPLSSGQLEAAVRAIGQLAGGSHRVALVVIDSVGALVRAEFDRDARMKRAEHLTSLAASIKRIADALKAVVIVANQVVRLIDDGAGLCGELDGEAGARLQPSLGVTWAHNVNARLLLQCAHHGAATRRSIRIEKSPRSAQQSVEVRILRGGLAEGV
ncbi:hypothetical protein KFE25_000855 [Diacronema lutheri]|uniref:RecA family profile 1 domain-containing protein n=1 Tax=Diacronema lutheri TaxID=2081491 RepID=A0A8J5XVX7_DIALT|nr:hypothetical protein KFE25_000855 [Diacronema lutheri]